MQTPNRTTAAAFPRYTSGQVLADSASLQWSGLPVRLDLSRALDSLRRELERPRKNHSDGKADDQQQNDQPNAQFGIPKNGNTCVAIWMSSQLTTA